MPKKYPKKPNKSQYRSKRSSYNELTCEELQEGAFYVKESSDHEAVSKLTAPIQPDVPPMPIIRRPKRNQSRRLTGSAAQIKRRRNTEY